jgi:hypothetical protein
MLIRNIIRHSPALGLAENGGPHLLLQLDVRGHKFGAVTPSDDRPKAHHVISQHVRTGHTHHARVKALVRAVVEELVVPVSCV